VKECSLYVACFIFLGNHLATASGYRSAQWRSYGGFRGFQRSRTPRHKSFQNSTATSRRPWSRSNNYTVSPKRPTFCFFLNNSVENCPVLNNFGKLNPKKIWHENPTLQICPPHLSDVATLPWEILKSHFQQCYSYILLIVYVISEENKLSSTSFHCMNSNLFSVSQWWSTVCPQ